MFWENNYKMGILPIQDPPNPVLPIWVRGPQAQGSYSGLPVLARVIKLHMFWGFIDMMTCKNSNCPCLSQNVCRIYDNLYVYK